MDDNLISAFFNTINAVIGYFVQSTYQQLISANEGVITLLFTVYIMVLGYRFILDDEYHSSINATTRRLICTLAIYTLVMSWDTYNRVLFNFFTNEPEFLSAIIINAAHQPMPGDSVLQALDSIWQKGMDITSSLYAQGCWNSISFYIYGTIALITTIVLCGLALGIFVYAKIGMAVMLAIGVIFIVLYLFNSTINLTQNWIQQLITFGLIPIVASSIMSLMYVLIDQTLSKIPTADPQHAFGYLCAYCLIGAITALLLWQTHSISSSLAGGVTLSGLQHAGRAISDLASASGLKTTGNIVHRARKKMLGKSTRLNSKK